MWGPHSDDKLFLGQYLVLLTVSIVNLHFNIFTLAQAIAGADPNAQDRWLCTPLHIAAKYNRPDAVRLLLLCGADKSIPGALLWSVRYSSPGSPSGGFPHVGFTPEELVVNLTSTSSASYVSQSILNPSVLNVLRSRVCVMCNKTISQSNSTTDDPYTGVRSCSTCDITLCLACAEAGSHWCVRAAFMERRQLAAGIHEQQLFPAAAISVGAVGKEKSPLPAEQIKLIRSLSSPATDFKRFEYGIQVEVENLNDRVASELVISPNFCVEEELHNITKSGSADCCSSVSETSTDSGFVDGQEQRDEILHVAGELVTEDCVKLNTIKPVKLLSRFRSFSFSTDMNRTLAPNLSATLTTLPPCRANSERRNMEEIGEKFHEKDSNDRAISIATSEQKVANLSKKTEDSNIVAVIPTPTSEQSGIAQPQRSRRASFKALFSRKRDSTQTHNPPSHISKPVIRQTNRTINVSVGSNWLQKVGLRRKRNSVSGADVDIGGRSKEEGGVPAYWLGYRGLEEWPLQSWQLYLLPLVIGPDPSHTLDSEENEGIFQNSKAAPPAFFLGDPEHLCFRNEVAQFYLLMSRDSKIAHLQASNVVGKPPSRRSRSLDEQEGNVNILHARRSRSNTAENSNIVEAVGLKNNKAEHGKMSTLVECDNTAGLIDSEPYRGNHEDLRRLQINELGRFFLSGKWTLADGDPLWTPDDSVWHCSSCFVVFTMFHRKHHCR